LRQNAAHISILSKPEPCHLGGWGFLIREATLHGTTPRPRRDYFSAAMVLLVLGVTIAWTAFLGWLLLRLGGVIG
jgi:hypothetical protein